MVGYRNINVGAKCQWKWPWLPRHQRGADRHSTVSLEVCVSLEWRLETRWGTLTHLNAHCLPQYGHLNCSALQNKEIKDLLKNPVSLGTRHLKIYCNSTKRFSVISLGGGNFNKYLMCKLGASVLHRDENKELAVYEVLNYQRNIG